MRSPRAGRDGKIAEAHAAVTIEDRAGHIARGVAAQKGHRFSDVAAATEIRKRQRGLHTIGEIALAGQPRESFGVGDRPRRDAVDPNAAGAPFERQTLGKHVDARLGGTGRSEEHTSELQSLMRISYAVFCLKKKKKTLEQHEVKKINKHNDTKMMCK